MKLARQREKSILSKSIKIAVTTKLLFFFPHNPYPARSGAHKRCLEMLAGLKALGLQVTLISSTLSSETPWEASSIKALKADWVTDVSIYEPTTLDRKTASLLRRYYRLMKQQSPLSSQFNTPLGMRRWFEQQFLRIKPEIIWMNYAYWDKLFSSRKLSSACKVIDSLDLVTLNTAMQDAVRPYLSPPLTVATKIDDRVLQEDFFQQLDLETSSEEFAIFDHYDHTIAISSKETELIRTKTTRTQVSYIPVLQPTIQLQNCYEEAAIFTTGPNLFNLQGYLYFVNRILPLVLKQNPSFLLQVTGSCCNQVYPTAGIMLSGYVPNLADLYQKAKFAICPVFGGTGQQIKIVEAMAHGLPVVATRFAGDRSPIIHGENGFIANDADEFAACVLQLWSDRELCQRLGVNARETISSSFSQDHLIKALSHLVK